MEHDEDCDKVNYEGGLCTCYKPASFEETADAASLAAMEDYEGPALDY